MTNKSEDRSRKTEDGRPKTEDRRRKMKGRRSVSLNLIMIICEFLKKSYEATKPFCHDE